MFVKVETYKTPIKRYSPRTFEGRIGVHCVQYCPKEKTIITVQVKFEIPEGEGNRAFNMLLSPDQIQDLINELQRSLNNRKIK